jgi:hypothetical protein
VLKELVEDSGYLVFDDMKWSHAISPSQNPGKNPAVLADFTEEQINAPHVQLVVDCLVRTDPRFEQVFLSGNREPYRAVFRKR